MDEKIKNITLGELLIHNNWYIVRMARSIYKLIKDNA